VVLPETIVRACIKFAFLLIAALCSAGAAAQAYPGKPVRIVIGFPPGGGIDIVARLMAPELGKSLGQPVIIDNKPGAAGALGTDIVAKSAPDGYTIFFGTTGNISINPVFMTNLSFNMDRDLMPLTQVASVAFLLYTYPGFAPKTLTELIAHAKANPGKVNFCSSATGGLPHLAGELLNLQAGIKTVHIPYKGSAPCLNDLMGGQVQFDFDAVAIGLQHVKSGRLRALASTGAKRLSFLPDIPAANESLPGFEVVNAYGMLLPAGTPRPIVQRLQHDIARVLQIPDLREKLVAQATDPVGSSPEEFAAFMKAESVKWARVIKTADVKPE
jgi:tripartite-type tricarboxylate transporter receptor subunit TctC